MKVQVWRFYIFQDSFKKSIHLILMYCGVKPKCFVKNVFINN